MNDSILSVRDLRKTFGAVIATDDCSLDVKRNEVHALIGPNGAGKSTLVAQISGDIVPDSGKIIFDGTDITEYSIQARVELGLVRSFQIPLVFRELTALENVALAVQSSQGHSFKFMKRALVDDALSIPAFQYLEQVDLDKRADVLVGALSHGEIRQLEIAMSLALSPRLLLLDEPMAGVGKVESLKITQLLRTLRSTVSILLIEHDMDVVFSLSDRVSVLVAGHPIATGSPEDVKVDERVRNVYLGTEA